MGASWKWLMMVGGVKGSPTYFPQISLSTSFLIYNDKFLSSLSDLPQGNSWPLLQNPQSCVRDLGLTEKWKKKSFRRNKTRSIAHQMLYIMIQHSQPKPATVTVLWMSVYLLDKRKVQLKEWGGVLVSRCYWSQADWRPEVTSLVVWSREASSGVRGLRTFQAQTQSLGIILKLNSRF